VTPDQQASARTRAVARLSALFGDRLTTNRDICLVHGRGEAFHAPQPPDAVVFPESTVEVAAIVGVCAAERVPVIGYGAGTSLEGNVTAPHGGICIDMSRMDAVLAVNAEDLDCTVQAGITREALNVHLRDTGLFFPVDPGANATLGGMAATRASGTTAVRYGTMRENVLSVEAVLANGTVVTTASRARKSSAGYDMTRLLVGSEGTLGIITAVTVRLHGQPEAVTLAVCPFDTLPGAVDTVIATMQLGVPIARIELLDTVQVRACNRYSGTALDEAPTLFLEFHGTPAAVAEQFALVTELAMSNGGRHMQHAQTSEDRSRLWRARHNAYHAAQALRPGSQLVVTDVCVPISQLAECIARTHDDIAEAGVVAPIVGHVGDGNFHVMYSVDPASAQEIAVVHQLNDRMVTRALSFGGTCTGEHGIGIGKRQKLIDELGAETVAMMAAVKQALDPQGILNPGKIFLPSASARQ
jgi:D-lactate dehydrogenase (cytochrome)